MPTPSTEARNWEPTGLPQNITRLLADLYDEVAMGFQADTKAEADAIDQGLEQLRAQLQKEYAQF